MKRRKLTLSTAFAAVVLASAGWLLTPGTAEADNQWYIYTEESYCMIECDDYEEGLCWCLRLPPIEV